VTGSGAAAAGTRRARSRPQRARPPKGSDQRARLLQAIVAVVAEHGYGAAKIGEIADRASVSRATFYELFEDKEACFAQAHGALAQRIGVEVDAAILRAEPADAAGAAIRAIAAIAKREPDTASFLTHHALLAGPRPRDSHDRLMSHLERSVEQAWGRSRPGDGAPDVPARVLLGGATRLLCMTLRRYGHCSPEVVQVLLRWVDCYRTAERPGSRRERLREHESGACRDASLTRRTTSPRILPRGRHRLPREVVDAIQRERIAYATADVIRAHDGTSVAVAEIVAAAGVSREVFYAYFSDKEQAFLAAHQLIFEQLMAASSSAFFTPGTSWPERVWDGASAFAGLLAANPSFAHFAFVAAYGIGETGVRRMDETALAFGMFLDEGYRARPQAAELSRLTSDAIALGVMETAALYVRNGRTAQLPAAIPTVAYTALAPFIGPDAAEALVDSKLG
jgi:AcrR family transcriptional regulator